MKTRRLPFVVMLAAVTAGAVVTSGYVIPNPERLWSDGTIQVHEQITGGTPGVLLDGSASLNVAFENALQTWNQYLGRIQFVPVRGSTVTVGDGDDVNSVFLSNTVFGTPFDSGVFAVTIRWHSTTTNRRLEFDTVFNSAYTWNSYRGTPRGDIKDIGRVALRQLGLAIGLAAPNLNGQTVDALMNVDGDLDTLTFDDMAGAASLYGAAPPTPGPSDPSSVRQFTAKTDADGIATFVPTGGRPFPVRFVDADTGVGIVGADAYLFTDPNGVGVAAIRDRSGQYFTQMAPVRLPLVVTSATTPTGVRPIDVPVPAISPAPQGETTPGFFTDLISKDTLKLAFDPVYSRAVQLFDAATATFVVERDIRLDQLSDPDVVGYYRDYQADEGLEFIVKSTGSDGSLLWKGYKGAGVATAVRDAFWDLTSVRLGYQGYANDQMFRIKVVRLIPTDNLPAVIKKFSESKIYITALEEPRRNGACDFGINCPVPGLISGRLTDATKPGTGIGGMLTLSNGVNIHVPSTGFFTSRQLQPGLYYVNAGATNYRRKGMPITVTGDGKVDPLNIALVPIGIQRIVLTPSSQTVKDNVLGLNFTATAYGADNRPYTPAPFFIWNSDNPAAATIDIGTGTIRPVKAGVTRITARAQQMTGSATLTVTRSAPCTYAVSPTGYTSTAAGGTGTFTVTTEEDCPWTAVSQSSGLTLASVSATAGNGSVRFSVAATTSTSSRTLSALIATKTVTVTQAGTTPTPTPTPAPAPTSGRVTVTSITPYTCTRGASNYTCVGSITANVQVALAVGTRIWATTVTANGGGFEAASGVTTSSPHGTMTFPLRIQGVLDINGNYFSCPATRTQLVFTRDSREGAVLAESTVNMTVTCR